ncbi:hypothetical protein CCMSSC00406_0006714 [Pleurotus cornucopiae]|uniref:Uncharacterized protein n=1 Tax=Pleurotus cornucopiae TaxID=5321 RepID=A0ACB7IV95_PLECO|nr:hypothetical protein CCMSSC00406_0006714 [Pleurotus cornucopiae]
MVCYLEDLALDTLLHIFLDLVPFDILSIRQVGSSPNPRIRSHFSTQCSKKLCAATQERIVWVKSLRHFCYDFHVCVSLFPIEHMSVRQLEHAVTAPTRFLRRLLQDLSAGNIRPVSTRILSPPDLTSSPINDVKLVTGGRLLIATAAGYQELQIWDLGFSPASVISPRPVLVKRTNGRIQKVLAQTTADSLGIMLLVNTRLDMPPQSLLEIYEMYPGSSDPVLHRLASWKFPNDALKRYASTVHICGPHVVAGYLTRTGGGEMLVWNYMDNTATKWDIDYVSHSDEINVYDGHIILTGEDAITVWKMPVLHARIPGVDVHKEQDLPYTSIDHEGLKAVHISHRQPRGLNGLHVDVFDPSDDGLAQLRRYVVLRALGDDTTIIDPRAPSIHPVFQGESPTSEEIQSDEDHYSSAWISDREMVMVRAEHDGYLVHASVIVLTDPLGSPRSKAAHGLIWVGPPEENFDFEEGPKIPRFTFCPVSGRVCVIDGHEIRVMDYLSV